MRNSIILIDFVEIRRREGYTLEDAIVDAGAVRFRPMLLTASAVVVGGFVILFDPIFQGLAIALMSGEIASTFLSRITVPILYYLMESRKTKSGPSWIKRIMFKVSSLRYKFKQTEDEETETKDE